MDRPLARRALAAAPRALPWALLALASWPTAAFCLGRIHAAEDALCLLFSLVAALVACREAGRGRAPRTDWAAVSAVTAVQAACWLLAPPVVAAFAGAAAVGSALSSRSFGTRMQPGVLLLLALGLPLLPSLEFAFGHPLRVLSTHGALRLLGLLGQAVEPVGTCLRGEAGVVCVDAPCAGIRMLWMTGFCVGALSAWRGLSWGRTALLAAPAFVAVLVANMLRTASLFVAETRVTLPGFLHEAVGLSAFALVLVPLLLLGLRPGGGTRCAPFAG